jgi:AbrB family looped-hinge helix DNA binding protein
MNTIISEKGQITIPKQIRNQLGLTPGTVIDIRTENGKLIGIKQQPVDFIHKWRGQGSLPDTMTTDEYLQETRE